MNFYVDIDDVLRDLDKIKKIALKNTNDFDIYNRFYIDQYDDDSVCRRLYSRTISSSTLIASLGRIGPAHFCIMSKKYFDMIRTVAYNIKDVYDSNTIQKSLYNKGYSYMNDMVYIIDDNMGDLIMCGRLFGDMYNIYTDVTTPAIDNSFYLTYTKPEKQFSAFLVISRNDKIDNILS